MNKVQNSVTLIGNIGKDAEMIKTSNGNPMAKFSMATNETYMKDGTKVTITQWHNCVSFGKKSEVLQKYAKKGIKIAIQGKLKYNNYTDKNGISRTAVNIEINDFSLLGKIETVEAAA